MPEHVLELAVPKIADATSKPPFLYEVGVDAARTVLDDIQAAPSSLPPDDDALSTPALDRPIGACLVG
jgi:acetyl esterase